MKNEYKIIYLDKEKYPRRAEVATVNGGTRALPTNISN